MCNQQLPYGTVINQGCLMMPKKQYLDKYKLVFEYTEEKDMPVIAVISPQDFKDAMQLTKIISIDKLIYFIQTIPGF